MPRISHTSAGTLTSAKRYKNGGLPPWGLPSWKTCIQETDGKDLLDVSNPKRSAKCEPPSRFTVKSGCIGATILGLGR